MARKQKGKAWKHLKQEKYQKQLFLFLFLRWSRIGFQYIPHHVFVPLFGLDNDDVMLVMRGIV